MCDFCKGRSFIEDEYGEWKLHSVKLTPLPPVILSGDIPSHSQPEAEPPYWALFLKYIDEGFEKGEMASFPIRFCPVCGQELKDGIE